MAGLVDRPRSGRPRELDHGEIVSATLMPPPPKLGVTHWSSRLLADHLGISFSAVAKAWREYGIQPWRAETFKFSTDPELVAKVTDVVGLYLDPPENAVVLCVDEKSQIQALDRTQPMLPMQPGRPERHTHDYVRHGTTTLFAALEIATGQVTGICQDRHRHQEFLRFLKHLARAYPDQELHLVMDNYAAHKRVEVRRLADRQPTRPRAFHPDLGIMAQPRRSLVRHHRTPSDPPWHLRQRPPTHPSDPHLHRRLEQSRPPIRPRGADRGNHRGDLVAAEARGVPLRPTAGRHDSTLAAKQRCAAAPAAASWWVSAWWVSTAACDSASAAWVSAATDVPAATDIGDPAPAGT